MRVSALLLIIPLLVCGSRQRTLPQTDSFQIATLYHDHCEAFEILDSLGSSICVGSRNRLLVTHDGGVVWNQIGSLPSITLVKQILHVGPAILLANTSSNGVGDLYLSTDSGRTFTLTLPCSGTGPVVYYDRRLSILYAATCCPTGIAVSSDSGRSWIFPEQLIAASICSQVCSLLCTKEASYISLSRPARLLRYDSTGWRVVFKDPKGENRELPLVTTSSGTDNLMLCLTSGSVTNEDIYLLKKDHAVSKAIRCPFSMWGATSQAGVANRIWIGAYDAVSAVDFTFGSLQETDDFGQTWNSVRIPGASLYWSLTTTADGSIYAPTDAGLQRCRLTH